MTVTPHVISADARWTKLVAFNARYGSGKSQAAKHLINLPLPLQEELKDWTRSRQETYQTACTNFLGAWHLELRLDELRQPETKGVRTFSAALALLIWETVLGTQDGFIAVHTRVVL